MLTMSSNSFNSDSSWVCLDIPCVGLGNWIGNVQSTIVRPGYTELHLSEIHFFKNCVFAKIWNIRSIENSFYFFLNSWFSFATIELQLTFKTVAAQPTSQMVSWAPPKHYTYCCNNQHSQITIIL